MPEETPRSIEDVRSDIRDLRSRVDTVSFTPSEKVDRLVGAVADLRVVVAVSAGESKAALAKSAGEDKGDIKAINAKMLIAWTLLAMFLSALIPIGIQRLMPAPVVIQQLSKP